MAGFFERVYSVVKTIPKGRVSTYGEIARYIGTRDSRKIGWALHSNKDANVPCHRVVNKEGRLAPNFAFVGANEQRRRLSAEGVTFKDEVHVDLNKHLLKL